MSSPNDSSKSNTPSKQSNLKKILRNSFRKTKNYFKSLDRKQNENDEMDGDENSNNNFYGIINSSFKKSKVVGDGFDSFSNQQQQTHPNDETYNSENVEQFYETIRSRLNKTESMQELSDTYFLKLINQIEYQQTIRVQLKNAIQICRNTKEFERSSELIEAERLTLLSHIKEQCAKLELYKIDYINKGLVVNPIKCNGTILITTIEFSLKEIALFDTHFNYFYVCICSYREQVKSTIVRERTLNSTKIKFNCDMEFIDLSSNFEIKVNVFVLRLRKNIRNYSHESKFHLNKVSSFYLCSIHIQLRNQTNIHIKIDNFFFLDILSLHRVVSDTL